MQVSWDGRVYVGVQAAIVSVVPHEQDWCPDKRDPLFFHLVVLQQRTTLQEVGPHEDQCLDLGLFSL